MARRRLILLAFLAAGLAAVAGTLTGHWLRAAKPPPAEPANAGLHVDPKTLDFGEVWEQDRFEWTVPVTNPGPRTIELANLDGSCSCTGIEPTEFTLAPGETRAVRLALDLRPNSCDSSPAPTRTFATSIRGGAKVGDGAPKLVAWQLRGTVKRPLRAVPVVAFGRCSELVRPILPLAVPLEPQTALESLTAESGTPDFQAVVRPASANPTRYELVVSPLSSLKRGVYSGSVTLTPVAVGGQQLPKVIVPVSAEVGPDIEAIPERVLVGARDVGAEVTEVVSLRSLSDRPFALEEVRAEGPGVSVSPGTDGRSCVVRVRVTGGGLLSGQVRVRVRPQDGEPVELGIPVSGYGFSPGE